MGFFGFFKNVCSKIKNAFNHAKSVVKKGFSWISERVREFFDYVRKKIKEIIEKVKNLVIRCFCFIRKLHQAFLLLAEVLKILVKLPSLSVDRVIVICQEVLKFWLKQSNICAEDLKCGNYFKEFMQEENQVAAALYLIVNMIQSLVGEMLIGDVLKWIEMIFKENV